MTVTEDIVNSVRGFNRFYTNILGLLDQHILDSDYSLTEARILFDLHETGTCTANTLSTKLKIDKSYLSRMLKRFEEKGLIAKAVSSEDSRASCIGLTQQGRQVIDDLSSASNRQIEHLFAPLSDGECQSVFSAMKIITQSFTKATTDIVIRLFTHKDIDYMIARQISMYDIEYGFSSEAWKVYIADGVQHLIEQFDPERDCVYILEANGVVSGCIAITDIEGRTAQLRFFFIEPTLRGLGAGNKLINMAISFCKEKQYKRVFLWTFSKLAAARHLYSKNGFQMTDTHENCEWGEPVLEERWDLNLNDS